jgi:hypothetical protein
MANEEPAAAPLQWVRATDFEEKYANNVRFESSGWDLKLIFGTLDQGTPDAKAYPACVRFHTAVAVPWRQAKLLAYSACMNVLWHQKGEGKITLDKVAVPPPVDVLIKDLGATREGKKLIELDKVLRSILFDEARTT